ncbi:hypothetical protein D3C77_495940 [compost metagenome]
MRHIRTKINPALDLMPYNEEVRRVNYEVHTEILTALKAHDSIKSREVMRRHTGFSAEAIYERVVAAE